VFILAQLSKDVCDVWLGDHGNLDAASHVETLRTHPVLGFLFNQRGGSGPSGRNRRI
jgi:hypothetical protein